MITDIVIGLQHGDEGKGKGDAPLAQKTVDTPTVCVLMAAATRDIRSSIMEKKFVTHHIPAGVFFGVTSVIGNGCVVDPTKLQEEIDYLESHGINVRENLRIANNAHVITPFHKAEDRAEEKDWNN